MRLFVYFHRTYSNAFFHGTDKITIVNRIRAARLLRMLQAINKARTKPLEYDMKHLKYSMWTEDDVMRKHRIEEECIQKENSRRCIPEWAKIISELYNSRREMHAKRVVAFLYEDKVGQIWMRKTLGKVPPCIQIVREM